MRPLSSALCLEVWELGRRLHDLDRALLALSCAVPEHDSNSLADWPLGRRNQALLELYSCTFGPRLEAETRCAQCGEQMEMELDAREMLKVQVDAWPETVAAAGHVFHLPSSRALGRVARRADSEARNQVSVHPDTLAHWLLEVCHVPPDEPLTLSAEQVAEVEQAMMSADPLAELRVALVCPECAHASEEAFAITSFLWERIEHRARLLLGEVHALASAYGWTEAEVFALGDIRRGLYLELVEQAAASRGAGTERGAQRVGTSRQRGYA